jgi:predicted RNA-binding protein with PIN domain
MIIDGYNVLHADERLKKAARVDLLSARRALVRRLTAYLKTKKLQMTLVFDGRGGITDVDVEIPGKLQVLFSSAGQTADDVIVGMLETSSNPRKYIVVTSDMADIGRAARAMGANVLSSSEFLDRMEPKKASGQVENEDAAADDIDYWLKKFGGDDKTGE